MRDENGQRKSNKELYQDDPLLPHHYDFNRHLILTCDAENVVVFGVPAQQLLSTPSIKVNVLNRGH